MIKNVERRIFSLNFDNFLKAETFNVKANHGRGGSDHGEEGGLVMGRREGGCAHSETYTSQKCLLVNMPQAPLTRHFYFFIIKIRQYEKWWKFILSSDLFSNGTFQNGKRPLIVIIGQKLWSRTFIHSFSIVNSFDPYIESILWIFQTYLRFIHYSLEKSLNICNMYCKILW